jgi:hypothetical protein
MKCWFSLRGATVVDLEETDPRSASLLLFEVVVEAGRSGGAMLPLRRFLDLSFSLSDEALGETGSVASLVARRLDARGVLPASYTAEERTLFLAGSEFSLAMMENNKELPAAENSEGEKRCDRPPTEDAKVG